MSSVGEKVECLSCGKNFVKETKAQKRHITCQEKHRKESQTRNMAAWRKRVAAGHEPVKRLVRNGRLTEWAAANRAEAMKLAKAAGNRDDAIALLKKGGEKMDTQPQKPKPPPKPVKKPKPAVAA